MPNMLTYGQFTRYPRDITELLKKYFRILNTELYLYLIFKIYNMAILQGDIQFTGSVGDLSFYREKGTNRIIVRMKGGPSKKQIQKDPAFEGVRKNNKEFGGCSMAGKQIRIALGPLDGLTNHNYSGYLNAWIRNILKRDTEHPLGQRAVYFSKFGETLNGFYLNRNKPLDTIVRTPITFTLNRNECRALVNLPAVDPKLHLINDYKYPFFRFVVSLCVVSDLEYNEKYKTYRKLSTGNSPKNCIQSGWHSTNGTCASQPLAIAVDKISALSENEALVLAAGIEFGTPDTSGIVQAKKYSGSGKILSVG